MIKIGVIGAGAAGLTVARLLHPRFDVRVFELGDQIGGNVRPATVYDRGIMTPVDLGVTMFLPRTFPHTSRLLRRLGLRWAPTQNSVSIQFADNDTRTNFDYHRRSFFRVADYKSARIRGLVGAWFSFLNNGRRFLRTSDADDLSLLEFFQENKTDPTFVKTILLPTVMGCWSLSCGDALQFSARTVLSFVTTLDPLNPFRSRIWQRIPGGMGRYIDALAAPFRDRITLRAAVESVERDRDGVWVTCSDRPPQRFDQVILSVPADRALALLKHPSPAERDTLADIGTSGRHTLVFHSDHERMERLNATPSAWNMVLREGAGPYGVDVVARWCHMNLLWNVGGAPYYVSRSVEPDQMGYKRTHLTYQVETPRFTPRTHSAQRRFGEVSGADRIHFCGAGWGDGLLEGAVTSAFRVARAFGRSLNDL